MPQPRRTDQRTLPGVPRLDDTTRSTRTTDDERHWEDEQAAKRAETAAARRRATAERRTSFLVLPARRCGRCRHWRYPSETSAPKHVEVDPFGYCGEAFMIVKRKDRYERGQVVSRSDVLRVIRIRAMFPAEKEPLRTMAHGGCRSFAALPVAQDPDADITDEAIGHLEEVVWAS